MAQFRSKRRSRTQVKKQDEASEVVSGARVKRGKARRSRGSSKGGPLARAESQAPDRSGKTQSSSWLTQQPEAARRADRVAAEKRTQLSGRSTERGARMSDRDGSSSRGESAPKTVRSRGKPPRSKEESVANPRRVKRRAASSKPSAMKSSQGGRYRPARGGRKDSDSQ